MSEEKKAAAQSSPFKSAHDMQGTIKRLKPEKSAPAEIVKDFIKRMQAAASFGGKYAALRDFTETSIQSHKMVKRNEKEFLGVTTTTGGKYYYNSASGEIIDARQKN